MSGSYNIAYDFTFIVDFIYLTRELIINTDTGDTAFQVIDNDHRFTIGVRARL